MVGPALAPRSAAAATVSGGAQAPFRSARGGGSPMIVALTRAAMWLAMQAAAADTMNVRQVAAVPSTFDKVTSVASGLLTLTMLALAIALIPAAWNFRKSFQKVNHLLERIY